MLLFYLLPPVVGFIQVRLGRPTFQLRKRRLAVEQSFLRWGCLDQQHIWIWCGWFSDVRNAFRIPCCILSESTKTSVAPYLFNQLINSLAVNIWEEEVQFAPGKNDGNIEKWNNQSIHGIINGRKSRDVSQLSAHLSLKLRASGWLTSRDHSGRLLRRNVQDFKFKLIGQSYHFGFACWS